MDQSLTQSLELVIWNDALVVCVAAADWTGGLAFGLAANTSVLHFSEITQSFEHGKSSSVSQLIKGKSRGVQKLLKYFNETTTSVFNILLLVGALPIVCVYPLISIIIFISSII